MKSASQATRELVAQFQKKHPPQLIGEPRNPGFLADARIFFKRVSELNHDKSPAQLARLLSRLQREVMKSGN